MPKFTFKEVVQTSKKLYLRDVPYELDDEEVELLSDFINREVKVVKEVEVEENDKEKTSDVDAEVSVSELPTKRGRAKSSK